MSELEKTIILLEGLGDYELKDEAIHRKKTRRFLKRNLTSRL